jgi:peptide/nickel transport system substrate-binding protein
MRSAARISLVGLLSLSIMLSSCSPARRAASTLVYGLTLAPSGMDPHLHASAELGIPLSSVYDTLVFRDELTGEYVPGLAERWSVSSDGREYTFFLRQDVTFHDGTVFNAQAVRTNIEYVLDPDHHSQKALSMLGPISGVLVDDDYTVTLILTEPYAPLLDSLSQVYLGMASPSALDRWGPAEYQFHQVGTGPYQFVEYIPNDHLLLRRNPAYAWAPSIYHKEVASLETIEFLFLENESSRALALEAGQVDLIGEIPYREAERLAESDSFDLYPIAIPGQPMQFFFNLKRAPTDDPLVRQALSVGLNRTKLVETIFGNYSPVAFAPLSRSVFGGLFEAPALDFDPSLAASLLEQAGWVDGDGDGIREKSNRLLELVLVVPPWGGNPQAAQLMEVAWEALGAEVEIVTAPGFGPLREQQAAGEYSAIGMNFFGTDADLLRPSYETGGFFNWSGLNDAELDALLASAARQFEDPLQRDAQYRQAIQKIMAAYTVLPLRDYVNLVVARSNIRGLRFSIHGWFPYLVDLELYS